MLPPGPPGPGGSALVNGSPRASRSDRRPGGRYPEGVKESEERVPGTPHRRLSGATSHGPARRGTPADRASAGSARQRRSAPAGVGTRSGRADVSMASEHPWLGVRRTPSLTGPGWRVSLRGRRARRRMKATAPPRVSACGSFGTTRRERAGEALRSCGRVGPPSSFPAQCAAFTGSAAFRRPCRARPGARVSAAIARGPGAAWPSGCRIPCAS